jgi:hypothetical protein
VYKEFKDDEEMVDYIPTFTCEMLTNELVEMAKKYGVDYRDGIIEKKPLENKKQRILEVIGGCITGWSNMYELSTAKEVLFTEENVQNLPESVVESIMVGLLRYAGVMPRGV